MARRGAGAAAAGAALPWAWGKEGKVVPLLGCRRGPGGSPGPLLVLGAQQLGDGFVSGDEGSEGPSPSRGPFGKCPASLPRVW